MNCIFLVNTKEHVGRVFSDISVDNTICDLSLENVFIMQDLIDSPGKFSSVNYVFSTWNMPVLSEEEIKKYLPNLKAVFYAAGTVKYFAEPFLRCGIKIFSAASANGIPVAEYTAAQIILANKGYYQAQREYRKPFWKISHRKARSFASNRCGNYHAKIGIIGAGTIGKLVIKHLKRYNLEIYVYDPYVTDDVISSLGVSRMTLDEMFSSCDIISNHLPDLPSTKGIINYSLLSKMKRYSTLINTGRGAQIEEKDLVRALKKDKTRCAVLDVITKEPVRPWSSLRMMKNVFLSPHIAGSTGDEEKRMADYMITAYYDFISGKENDTEVSLSMFSTHA